MKACLARYMTLALRARRDFALTFVQPIIYLALFGPLFVSTMRLQGTTRAAAYSMYVTGLSIQMAMTIGAFVGLTIILEYRLGILERIWSTPAKGSTVMAGRITRDVLLMSAPILVVFLVGLVLGARPSARGLMTYLVTVLGTGTTFAGISYAVALKTKSEGALSAIFNLILLPILLLSGIMLPMSFAPHWIVATAHFNPLWHLVQGAREQFSSNGLVAAGARSWVITLLMSGIAFGWATREFDRRR